jgi:hypothetical protein
MLSFGVSSGPDWDWEQSATTREWLIVVGRRRFDNPIPRQKGLASLKDAMLGDFDDRDGLNRASGGPDVRSGLSCLPARVRPRGQLLPMPLHVAASVQRVGIGPGRPVRHQSIFRDHASARGTALSPRLLNIVE